MDTRGVAGHIRLSGQHEWLRPLPERYWAKSKVLRATHREKRVSGGCLQEPEGAKDVGVPQPHPLSG